MKLSRRAFFKGVLASVIAAVAVVTVEPAKGLTKEMCEEHLDRIVPSDFPGYHEYDTGNILSDLQAWGPPEVGFSYKLPGTWQALDRENTVVQYGRIDDVSLERLMDGSLNVHTVIVDSLSEAMALEMDRAFLRGHA